MTVAAGVHHALFFSVEHADISLVMISGVMPKWRRYFHRTWAGFMCVLFSGFTIMAGIFGMRGTSTGLLVASVLFAAMGIAQIAGMVVFLRRVVAAFDYDGWTLRYRTLASDRIETGEIAKLLPWRGRSGRVGYCVVCRDKKKLYLEYSVSNAAALAGEILERANHSGDSG